MATLPLPSLTRLVALASVVPLCSSDLDQIQEDIAKHDPSKAPKFDQELPGCGQYYCLVCASVTAPSPLREAQCGRVAWHGTPSCVCATEWSMRFLRNGDHTHAQYLLAPPFVLCCSPVVQSLFHDGQGAGRARQVQGAQEAVSQGCARHAVWHGEEWSRCDAMLAHAFPLFLHVSSFVCGSVKLAAEKPYSQAEANAAAGMGSSKHD